MSVGKRIRAAREAAGMTQAEVAKRLSVSESSIRLYELGKRQPNDEILGRIAEVVGVDPQAFIEVELSSVRDVLEILFRLEDACGLIPLEDGKLDVDRTNEHAPKLNTNLGRVRSNRLLFERLVTARHPDSLM